MVAMSAAVVRTATVIAAAVTALAVLVIVVVALDVGMIVEVVRKKRLDCRIARADDTAIELDAGFGKCHLCATADAAADENVSADDLQKLRKRSVSLSVGIDHFVR